MTKLTALVALLFLTACCGGGNPDCIGMPVPWLWFNGNDEAATPQSYEDAVKALPKGTCNDTGEDWPGVPKCKKQ